MDMADGPVCCRRRDAGAGVFKMADGAPARTELSRDSPGMRGILSGSSFRVTAAYREEQNQ